MAGPVRRFDWGLADVVAGLGALAVVAWIALPTSVFLRPADAYIDGDEIVLVRNARWFDVVADWTTEIENASGQECHNAGRSVYQQGLRTVRWTAGEALRECIERGPPMTIRMSWGARLFGVIPLRKTYLTRIVDLD